MAYKERIKKKRLKVWRPLLRDLMEEYKDEFSFYKPQFARGGIHYQIFGRVFFLNCEKLKNQIPKNAKIFPSLPHFEFEALTSEQILKDTKDALKDRAR